MIPDSVLENNPLMGKFSKIIADRNICRICLIETDQQINNQLNTVLRKCFTASTLIAEKLPKCICRDCSRFLKKCDEFRIMVRRSELTLISYPLSGVLPDTVEVPSWLRPVQKRKQEATSQTANKKICNKSGTKAIHAGTNNLVPVNSTLQSPTITSEVTSPQKETQCNINTSAIATEPQRSITPGRTTVIQQMQTYVETFQASVPNTQHYRYQSSPVFATSNQKSNGYPILQQSLQQPSLPTSVNDQLPIPLQTPNQQTQQIVPQQTVPQQPYQQPSQQPSFNQQIQSPFINQNQQALQTAPQQLYQQPSQQPMPTFQQPQQPPPPVYHQSIQPAIKPNPPPQQTTPTAIPVFPCNFCQYLFPKELHRVAHMRKHIGINKYHCSCGRHFAQLNEYVHHFKQHTSATQCELCMAYFPVVGSGQLKAHLDQHVRVGLQQACDFCPLIFVDWESQRQHMDAQHKEDVQQLMKLNRHRYKGKGVWT